MKNLPLSNYPAGAEHDPRAPYNEVEEEIEMVDVDVLYTLRKKDQIGVSDYEYEYDENGNPRGPYFDESNMESRWKDQKFTPAKILTEIVWIYGQVRLHGWSLELQYELHQLAEYAEHWVEDYIEVSRADD